MQRQVIKNELIFDLLTIYDGRLSIVKGSQFVEKEKKLGGKQVGHLIFTGDSNEKERGVLDCMCGLCCGVLFSWLRKKGPGASL
jgi:hypothetical protein